MDKNSVLGIALVALGSIGLLGACGPKPPINADSNSAAHNDAPHTAASQAVDLAAAAVAAELVNPADGTDCAGKDLRLSRDDSDWVIHGRCAAVSITATKGAANISSADSIDLSGSEFTVLNEKVAQLRVSGSNNTLNLTEADELIIEGDNNIVLATQVGRVKFTGKNNAVNVNNSPELEDSGTGNKVI